MTTTEKKRNHARLVHRVVKSMFHENKKYVCIPTSGVKKILYMKWPGKINANIHANAKSPSSSLPLKSQMVHPRKCYTRENSLSVNRKNRIRKASDEKVGAYHLSE